MIVNKRIIILLSMLFVSVLVLGCTGEKRTDVVSTDLLKIGDITVIPSETVKPDDTIVIRMDVENVGQTDVWMLVDKDSKSGTNFNGDMVLVNYCAPLYTLENAGFQVVSKTSELCTLPTDTDMVNALPTIAGASSVTSCYLKFKPGETHVFQWRIKAPSKDKIAGMTNDCKFNFQAIYGSVAKTFTYVYFAKPGELAQRIYTDKELTLAGDNIASYGPVVTNFETDAQPIRSGANDEWTVFMNLKNLGSGIAKIQNIYLSAVDTNMKLKATTNCELYDGGDVGFYLSRSNIDKDLKDAEDGGCTLVNKDGVNVCDYFKNQLNKLEIFVTESSRVSCTLKVPDGINIMQPYKFKALAMYSYSQGEDLKITTDPTP